jgi:hypothetical protein
LAASEILKAQLAGGALRTFRQKCRRPPLALVGVYRVTVRIEQPTIKKRLHLTRLVSELDW